MITKEAKEFLRKLDNDGGVPAFMSSNFRRILIESGVNVTKEMTPNEGISELKKLNRHWWKVW